jgi:hypothetical protein
MQLQIFEYKEERSTNNIRTIEVDGEIWFVAKDVCDALGIINVSDSVSDLDSNDLGKTEVVDYSGRIQPNTNIVNESGLYTLIFKSKKPKAKQFKRWITNDVIPSIRKTGKYGVLPIFVRRFNDNWDRVERGYFSIISELFIRVYGKLEQVGHLIPDKAPDGREIRPDVSVGKTFPSWLAIKYPDKINEFKTYKHILPNELEVDARQYKNEILPYFIEYIETDWLYNRAKDYFEPRDPLALNYLPKILEGQKGSQAPLLQNKEDQKKNLTPFDQDLKGLLNVPPLK